MEAGAAVVLIVLGRNCYGEKNDLRYNITMQHVQVFTYPQRKLFEGKLPSDKTVDELIGDIGALQDFDITDRVLIIDRNQNFHRIGMDDAINRYYNGRLGELYLITDVSEVRYRLVVPPIPVTKDKGKTKEKRATADVYASAYENALTMLQDRGCDPDILTKFSIPREHLIEYLGKGQVLTIPGLEVGDEQLVDSRGRASYVFFLQPADDMVIKKGNAFKMGLTLMMNRVIEHHNSRSEEDIDTFIMDDLLDQKKVQTFADQFEIVIVYNNPFSKPDSGMDIKPRFYQPISVQNLSFVVTEHVDQPHFKILDKFKDVEGIRQLYAQNGRILEGDKTVSSYKLRDNVRLMLI